MIIMNRTIMYNISELLIFHDQDAKLWLKMSPGPLICQSDL